jgi:hypothetical protein
LLDQPLQRERTVKTAVFSINEKFHLC